MQITSDISSIWENVQRYLTFIFYVLSESRIGFVLFLVFLALEMLLVSQKLVFIENEAVKLCVPTWKHFTLTLAPVWHKSFLEAVVRRCYVKRCS